MNWFRSKSGVNEISAAQLREQLSSAEPPLVIDVREVYELREGVIPSAIHVPMNNVPARLSELPPEREIVIHCSHGFRSYDVAAWLMRQGYERVSSLAGGMAAWQRLRV